MKAIKKYIIALTGTLFLVSSCSDFEDTNKDPQLITDRDQLRAEFALHGSIVRTQQNPHYGERIFVLTWKALARHNFDGNSAALGNPSDEYMVDYWKESASWITQAQTAIDLADYKMNESKVVMTEDERKIVFNLKQCARIWQVYLMSEVVDMFGALPDPSTAFRSNNPNYIGAKEAYAYFQTELKDAASKLDLNVKSDLPKYDMAYGYNPLMWKKYANSMRMRFAMRIAEVDNTTAKAAFEDAISEGIYIDNLSSNFAIQEKGNGWDYLSAVMSRQWNAQILSSTLNNLLTGLGGIESSQLLDSYLHSAIKPENYIGVQYLNHFATTTNNPMAGFWFDGLPNKIDPRAYKLFCIPGDLDNPEFAKNPDYNKTWSEVEKPLMDPSKSSDTLKMINAKFTWNGATLGAHSTKGSLNKVYNWNGANPRLTKQFRTGDMKRIFFASWESYFLIAEAALRGWNVPMSAQAAYEKGITENFSYFGVEAHVSTYLASTNYNNVGTSVKWDHITEPPTTRTMTMKDGYSGATGTYEYKYPVAANTRYGKTLNDQLTKIITQKYIANTPWLGLECWSDHRRLGLPFFDTPVVEVPITTMPALTQSNFGQQQKDFFTQRIPFPSILSQTNKKGYEQAVAAIGGKDNAFAPVWWAKQN